MVRDENGNFYPAIYTRNTNNDADHLEQVGESLAELRQLGFKPVSPEVYFDKCLAPSFYHQQRLERVVYPLLDRKTSSPEDDNYVVFVYDIEEITMLSDDNYVELAQLMPEVNWNPLWCLIESLFSEMVCATTRDIKNKSVEELSRRDHFRQLYYGFPNRKKSILSEELFELLEITEESTKNEIRQIIVEHQKVFHQRWKAVEKCLKWVQKMSKKTTNKKKYANVVVCEDIAQGATELILSQLSSSVPLRNIFPTESRSCPTPVFTRIKKRFGKNCHMIHVNTNRENHQFHGNLQIPVWWISSNESFEQLYRAQRDLLSK